MQSLRQLRTLALVTGGKNAGRVVQGVLSDDLKHLEGIWTDSGFGGLRFIEAEKICVIGKRAVITEDRGERLRIKPRALFIRAVSASGKRLGAISDAMIDETSLMVKCLMLSRGYAEYLAEGYIPITAFHHDRAARRVVIPEEEIDQEVFR